MNKTRQLLTNPFVTIAGAKALIYGLAALVLTSITGYFWQTRFDGVLDIHFGIQHPYHIYLFDLVISYVTLALVLYLAGLIFSRSGIRMIDVAGTVALARAPLLLAPLANTFSHSEAISEYMLGMLAGDEIAPPEFWQSALFGLSTLIIIALTIYVIILTYRAFSISVNLKGNRAVLIFIMGILVSEVVSKILIHNFIHPIF